MCWQCDNPNGTTEEYLDELRASVRLHSWVVQGVEDDRLPFAYTIGLHDRALPELLRSAPARLMEYWQHRP